MLTPEAIEALDPKDLKTIAETAAALHEAVAGVLDLLNPHDVEIQQDLRKKMKLKLDEAMSLVAKEIADLEALKRDLRIRKGYQASDHDRIESHKIGLFVKAKELRDRP